MAKKMTMADIANLSGVGKSTVSRYFNGGYVRMRRERRFRRSLKNTTIHRMHLQD